MCSVQMAAFRYLGLHIANHQQWHKERRAKLKDLFRNHDHQSRPPPCNGIAGHLQEVRGCHEPVTIEDMSHDLSQFAVPYSVHVIWHPSHILVWKCCVHDAFLCMSVSGHVVQYTKAISSRCSYVQFSSHGPEWLAILWIHVGAVFKVFSSPTWYTDECK